MRDQHNDVRRSAFTLIEVLVVVAIIALLVSVLLPALKRARETSRITVCLSNLKQQGIGMKMYSADQKSVLPWAGSFRFSLMEGKYYLGYGKPDPTWVDWAQVNLGVLFPRYVGNTSSLYYCPNNLAVDMDGPNGKARFFLRYNHPLFSDPLDVPNSHDFPTSPFSAYCYAPPVALAKSPRDAASKMFPEESVRYYETKNSAGQVVNNKYPYWDYLQDTTKYDASFPGPTSREARGKHPIHALVSDGFNSGQHEGDRTAYEGYHLKSYNVLYGDYHAKRVVDPYGRIHAAKLNTVRPDDTLTDNTIKVFRVWDYFSQNP